MNPYISGDNRGHVKGYLDQLSNTTMFLQKITDFK